LEDAYVELEIYTPYYSLVYADIIEIGKLDPLESTELYETFNIPSVAPPGIYIIVARFGEGVTTLATYTGNFYVAGAAPGYTGLIYSALIIVALVVLFFSFRRLRGVRRER
jgi:hypothetical protein